MRGDGDARRRFARAAVVGSVLALVADVLLLSAGSSGLTGSNGAASTLIDVQARAFQHGHLAVSASGAGIEGFLIGDRTYLYFGPVVPLLHLPFLLVGGHGVDGHLTALSMAAAFAALLAATAVLHWRVRMLLRPAAPFGRTDAAGALLLQVAVGAGAVPLYLAGWVAVYHEVELWGAALTIGALAALVGVVRAPSVRGVAWAGVLATLAVNTRVSVGYGAVAALGALAVALGAGALSPHVGAFGPDVPADRRWRLVTALLVAALVAVVSSSAINELRFHQAFGLPLDRQVFSHVDAHREAALAANPDGLFGLKFVPTALLAYTRPDAIGVARAFPFVGVPGHRPTVVGTARFDTLENSLSATTSMTLLSLLTLVALVGLLRGGRERRPLWTMLVSSSVGMAAALTLAYVTTRYLADLLPTLVVGATAGLQLLVGRTTVAGSRARRARRALIAVTAALVLVGVVVNGSAGLLTQQLLHPATPMAARAAFVRTQDDVDRWLGRAPHGVHHGATLPASADVAPGDLFVVGPCAGLYAATLSGDWIAVERTPATGLNRLSVRLPRSTDGRWVHVVDVGAGRGALSIDVRGSGGRLRFRGRRAGVGPAISGPFAVPTGHRVVLVLDSQAPFGSVTTAASLHGRQVLFATGPTAIGPAAALGRGVRVLPTPAPVCRRIARRAGIAIS